MIDIKNIITALDSSDFSFTALKYAIEIAKHFSAKVDAIHVIDILQLEGPFIYDLSGALGFEPFINFSTQVRGMLEEKGNNILSSFKEVAQNNGVDNKTFMDVGIVATVIVEKSQSYDLVFVGRKGINASYKRDILGSNIESLVRKIQKPLFVSNDRFYNIKNIVVAFNNTDISKKAYRYALLIGNQLNAKVSCIYVSNKKEDENNIFKEINNNNVKKEIIISNNRPAALVEFTNNLENSLLCIGAYSRSRFMEMLLGSTTETVLRKNIKFPLLIIR